MMLMRKFKKNYSLNKSEIRREEILCAFYQLIALNALRNKIFLNVSHDIRNPMSAMVSMMEVLDDDYHSSESREIVHEVRKQVESTFLAVDNMLDLINCQRDKSADAYLLKAAQKTVCELLNFKETDGIRIGNNLEGTVTVFINKEILETVLHNLFNSALEFFNDGRLISIQTRRTGRNVIITIRDTGMIVSFNEVNTLFTDTYKAPSSETTCDAGLGVLICKDFFDCTDTKIWTDNIAKKNNTFYLYLFSEK